MAGAASYIPFTAFLRLGFEHIFTGFDHLLFLLGLLLVCRSWRRLLIIVTCFTLGHSLTLALATLNIVYLPSRWAEPLIAFTICFVGVENFWRRDSETPWRPAVALLFGLIHGFGFATVLRDLGLGTEGWALAIPLFAFNLGVELGQLAFAAAVLPPLWWAWRQPAFVRFGVPALSALVALAGCYWLLERLLLA